MPVGLGLREIRALAARYGVRPSKSFGQSFLADPNLARAMAADAGAGPGVRVVEVGAGFGSLTVALASTGATVLAIEFDRAIVPALREVVSGLRGVTVVAADALEADWGSLLGRHDWTMTANLPYNIAVPLVLRMLEEAPQVSSYVTMVQREVADRLAATPGSPDYGAVSVKVAYRADVAVLRRVPPEVFWPRPNVESSVVRLTPRPAPIGVRVDDRALFAVVDAAFAERRKTMANAVRRLGLAAGDAGRALEEAGVEASARPERLGLEPFARLAAVLARDGVVPGR